MTECDIVQPHVGSFDAFIDQLPQVVAAVPVERFKLVTGECVEISLSNAILQRPTLGAATAGGLGGRSLDVGMADAINLYPSECRQRATTYAGALNVSVLVSVNGVQLANIDRRVGTLPIMLRSKMCHLAGGDRAAMVRLGEEPTERGGYFVVNGSEKIIRCVVVQRRNYPLALQRDRYIDKGPLFSPYALSMRCVTEDTSATLFFMHYVVNGNMVICIVHNKETFFLPLIYVLKALLDCSDATLARAMMTGREHDDMWEACVMNMLHIASDDGVVSQAHAHNLIGSRFRVVMRDTIAPWESNATAGASFALHAHPLGERLVNEYVCPHLPSGELRLHALAFMARKLYAVVRREVLPESPDNPQFQEALTPGHLFMLLIKERLQVWNNRVRKNLQAIARRREKQNFVLNTSVLEKAMASCGNEFTRSMESFLSTGNLPSTSGLALPQQNGFAVIADRINQLRFLTNFRALHRGSFFQTMRTTDVRKLRPEAWGFICPVHTPDGGPCGLLNHITAGCEVVVARKADPRDMCKTLEDNGCVRIENVALQWPNGVVRELSDSAPYPVWMDGALVAYVSPERVPRLMERLRKTKVSVSAKQVPSTTELAFIKRSRDVLTIRTQMPGVYVFTESARLVRPVKNRLLGKTEWIGTFEQVYMSICISPEEGIKDVTQHQEISPNSLFSFAGNLIPFPDHNQSPRNVYQCQMGKQTMAVPVHAWDRRADNKLYRLLYLQKPMVKPEAYDKWVTVTMETIMYRYDMDEYPLGTNAVVAVAAYSGYDMEDAMCINAASHQRGFGHGHIYKCERLNLLGDRMHTLNQYFARDPNNAKMAAFVGEDGLPIVGQQYEDGDTYASIFDCEQNKFIIKKFKGLEKAYVTMVRAVRPASNNEQLLQGIRHVVIQWRLVRNPIIGDKFASRHGQKGINSFLWPVVNMPFSETGMVPDLLFNPHGYPSRMTIGMMIESMAGKSAAHHGWLQDATPFVFDEQNPAIGFYGDILSAAGYNYVGTEPMYSGIDGRLFEVELFVGVIYYQRLRHMVADKFQVRATGPIDATTHQPVKGRKRMGGIRFGEMERDAMIAHGCSFLLRDRLMTSSDVCTAHICQQCGSLLTCQSKTEQGLARHHKQARAGVVTNITPDMYCLRCGTKETVRTVQVPYVLRYLVAELLAANIKIAIRTDRD